MAESSFIKTVAFGGYDKLETEKLFEAMNQQICELQNELRQNRLLLENYKSDTDEEKNFESVLSAERTKLSQLQVQNETLTAKNKDLSAEMRDKELEIRELKASVEDLKKKLSAAGNSGGDNSAAAMSKAFLEAQRSSDEMLERARDEAESLRKNAVRLAESIISEANEKAEKIISEANEKASFSAEDQQNNNILFENFSKLGSQLNMLKDLLSDFEKSGMERIAQCENIISDTAENMKNSSAEAPVTQTVSAPDKAENFSSGKTETESTSDQPENESAETIEENSSSEDQSDDLDMLMAMAEALNED